MVNKRTLVANWKMAKLTSEIQSFMDSFSGQHRKIESGKDNVKILIGASAVHIPELQQQLKDSAIQACSQDVSAHEPGAYTGEVSAEMLADLGVRYSIVGHSERRQYHGEQEEIIEQKIRRLVANHITPIVCIGEKLQERQEAKTNDVLAKQLQPLLSILKASSFMVAYEPVWAIGTGLAATIEQANDAQEYIKALLKSTMGTDAEAIPVLYGGSVKPENARTLLEAPAIDGFLVGGASLDPNSFLSIFNAF